MSEKTKDSTDVLKSEIATQEFFIEMAKQMSALPDVGLQLPNLTAMLEYTKKTLHCVENRIPFIQSWYVNGPELYAAMDLHWDSGARAEFGAFLAMFDPQYLDNILKESDRVAIGRDICTLHRLGLAAVETGKSPKPWAAVSCIHPCDGISLYQSVVERTWHDVPMLWMDSPYRDDEAGVAYFAHQLRRMVAFCEEHTGKKLDIDRLREVITITNEQYVLWQEFDALKRNKPCPVGSWSSYGIWNMMQNNPVACAQPVTTEYIKGLINYAEQQIQAGKGHIANEKVRVLWMDIAPIWLTAFSQILEQECNAVVVQEAQGGSYPYTLIDTTNEETMFMGLAKRYCMDTPMIRTSRGSVDTIINDLIRNVEDYQIDMVIAPGHMGHRDMQAALTIVREVCRDLDVKLLNLQYDLFDNRYTPMEEIRGRVCSFIEAMDA